MQKTSCHRLITTQVTLRSLTDAIQAELAANHPEFELTVDEMPSLDEVYPKLGQEKAGDPFEPYPQEATWGPVTDIVMYLHSSGSSGFPKAIPQSRLTLTHWAAFRKFNK